jgi:hypothetical protein
MSRLNKIIRDGRLLDIGPYRMNLDGSKHAVELLPHFINFKELELQHSSIHDVSHRHCFSSEFVHHICP